ADGNGKGTIETRHGQGAAVRGKRHRRVGATLPCTGPVRRPRRQFPQASGVVATDGGNQPTGGGICHGAHRGAVVQSKCLATRGYIPDPGSVIFTNHRHGLSIGGEGKLRWVPRCIIVPGTRVGRGFWGDRKGPFYASLRQVQQTYLA